MQQAVTVGDLVVLHKYGLVQEWFWRNWNQSQKNGGDENPLSESAREYEFSRVTSLSMVILGILYIVFSIFRWYEHFVFVSLVLSVMLIEILRKYFKRCRALSRFASDLYELRKYLNAHFNSHPCFDDGWAKARAKEVEAAKALAVLLQQADDPSATSLRNEFEQQHRLLLKFQLVSPSWDIPFEEARRTVGGVLEARRA